MTPARVVAVVVLLGVAQASSGMVLDRGSARRYPFVTAFGAVALLSFVWLVSGQLPGFIVGLVALVTGAHVLSARFCLECGALKLRNGWPWYGEKCRHCGAADFGSLRQYYEAHPSR
jgi:hypothetical protein